MTPPAIREREQRETCNHHCKLEYQVDELVKSVNKHDDELAKALEKRDNEYKSCKERQDEHMAEVKKELQALKEQYFGRQLSTKILIALIGAAGVMFSATGSVIGVLIVAYFKTTTGVTP